MHLCTYAPMHPCTHAPMPDDRRQGAKHRASLGSLTDAKFVENRVGKITPTSVCSRARRARMRHFVHWDICTTASRACLCKHPHCHDALGLQQRDQVSQRGLTSTINRLSFVLNELVGRYVPPAVRHKNKWAKVVHVAVIKKTLGLTPPLPRPSPQPLPRNFAAGALKTLYRTFRMHTLRLTHWLIDCQPCFNR